MTFEADAGEEFEAGCELFVDRLVRWAEEQRLPVDAFLAEAALEYRHEGTVDGRLGLWEPRHVDELLLSWLPERVTELPGEEPGDGPGTVRTLVRFLHAMRLADPRGPVLEESLAAVDAAADRYPAAMEDPSRWGLAKFWTMTAAGQGVDVLNDAAMQRFADRVQAGEADFEQHTLDAIMERRLTGRGLAGAVRAEPQLPVVLPPDDELRRRAGASAVVAQLRGLAEWAGRDGRAVTGAGRLRMADARALVEALGTGDKTEGVRSSADLPRLGLLVEWAKKARLVRVVKGRLYAVAKARAVLADPLRLWSAAFDAFFELRQALIGARSGWHMESMLFDAYEAVLEDVLNTLYSLPHPMPWPHLRDSVHLAYRARFDIGSDSGAGLGHRMWFDHADRDLHTVLDVLEDFGAIEREHGTADPVFLDVDLSGPGDGLPPGLPAELAELLGAGGEPRDEDADARDRVRREELAAGPVELIRLTELGTHALRRRLLVAGRDAPLVGELAQAPAAGLLGVLADDYNPDSARTELAGWLAAHGARDAALRQLTDAVAVMVFRTRAQAMLDVLLTALPDGERLLRGLRGDARLAPLVLSALVHRDLLLPADMTDGEHLLVLAESLLQLVELAGGGTGAEEALRAQGPEVRDALAAALDSAHPDRAGLEELRRLGHRAFPVKAARRSAKGRKRRPGRPGRR
ncbi:hypothetical protein [Streptomyces smaragdinus]|nr:hypothetical protein [Streptomyces smaragdinus]